MIPTRIIGGHAAPEPERLQLFRVTIPTSIEDIEDYVLAPNQKMVEDWLVETHKYGFAKGYEPIVERLDRDMLGSIYLLSTNPSVRFLTEDVL